MVDSLRIIPAYAGSTRKLAARGGEKVDHPRIRGEHRNFPNFVFATWGSSPHTRGALRGAPGVGGAVRIIPAYAGSTFQDQSALRQ